MGEHDISDVLIRRVILGVFFVGLLVLGYRVLSLFFVPVAWAAILTYVTWPVHRSLRRGMQNHPTGSAFLMTLLLAAVFALPLLWVISLLRTELPASYQALTSFLAQGPDALPESLARVPWLGPELQRLLDQSLNDRPALTARLVEWVEPWRNEIAAILGDVGRNAFKFAFALFTAFFLYRDGEGLFDQTRQVLLRLLGERVKAYLGAIGDTTRAVVYGLIFTALVQGLLAGLGYWAVGVQAPALLGVFTAAVALIPFGPPFVWGPIGGWLILSDRLLAGIGLLLWGALVVSQIDNLIRPFVISSATRIPFLLVFFGVLGGISTFGLIGLFLGPVVVAMLLAVWREWLEEQTPPEPPASAA